MSAQPTQQLQFTLLVRGVETFVLPQSPKGWEGALLNQSRDTDFFGMFRKYTESMDFVLDGAWILRKEFYNYGLAAAVQLKIEKQDAATWTYKQIYLGDVDFSTFKDSGQSDGYIVSVGLIEAGITAMVRAYKDVVYSIPIRSSSPVSINLNGIKLHETAQFAFDFQGTRHDYYFPGLTITSNKIASVNQSAIQVAYDQFAGPDFNTRQSFFFLAQTDCQVKMTNVPPENNQPATDGAIQGTIFISNPAATVGMFVYNQHGDILYTIVERSGGDDGTGAFGYSVNVSKTFSLVRGDKLFIYINGSTPDESIDITAGSLYLEYQTISPPTTCLALNVLTIYDALMQQMFRNVQPSDAQVLQTASRYLFKAWGQLFLTCGDAIKPGLTPIYILPGFNLIMGLTYIVQKGTVNYRGILYSVGDAFVAGDGFLTYTATGNGYVQQVPDQVPAYYPGDSLIAGYQYQVVSGSITYNGRTQRLGTIFFAINGVNSFTDIVGGIPTNGYVIQTARDLVLKTSFSDFFKSINAVANVGFGVENGVATLEDKAYWFKNALPTLNVGNVKEFNLEVYTPYVGNSLVIGYPDQTYDVVDGVDEYNSQQNYVMPIVRVQKQIDLMSVYRADMYGIEFLRIQAGANQATKGDSEVFFIKTQQNPVTDPTTGQTSFNVEGPESFISVVGTTAGAQAFNLDITPKRNLMRHGNYLHGILDKYDGYLINFASCLKSASLATISLDGRQVSELANVDISGLDYKLFLPYLVTIKTKLPIDSLGAIDGAPTGFITFTQDGNSYTMFLLDCSVDVAKNKEQTWKGLLCPSNQLGPLIH